MKPGKTLEDTKRREKILQKRDDVRESKFKLYLKGALSRFKRNRKSRVKIVDELKKEKKRKKRKK